MRKFKTGGVSICYHCGRQLVRVAGGFKFAILLDPDNRELRVHVTCMPEAVGHGYREAPKQPTI